MSKIRLHGSSSGYMEIAPPAAASSATVTLPNSAGEVLLSDGSAASLTQIPAANLVGVCTAGFSDGVVGSYVHLNTTTVSSSVSSITFDSSLITSTYSIYKIQFHGLKGTVAVSVQVSPDNGSTYRTSGYNGARNRYYTTDSGSSFTQDTTYYSTALYYSSVGQYDAMTQEITITSINSSSVKTACIALGGFGFNQSYHTIGHYGGRYDTAESHNNIRIVGSSGDFTAGSVSLYGVKA